jgi:hypothetical protein
MPIRFDTRPCGVEIEHPQGSNRLTTEHHVLERRESSYERKVLLYEGDASTDGLLSSVRTKADAVDRDFAMIGNDDAGRQS